MHRLKNLFRNPRFARHSRLAEPAAVAFKAISLFHEFATSRSSMFPACFLVVTLLGNGPHWAPFLTASARTVVEKEAVRVVIVIWSIRNGDGEICDHGTYAMCLSFGGNQPVAETKGPKTCRICCMTLGPF